MKSIEKEFVPHQESLELKELGFDEPCLKFYAPNLILGLDAENGDTNSKLNGYNPLYVSAPTFSQAFRWFREKHGLNSFVYHYGKDGILDTIYFAYNINDNLYASDFKTHEEAELACLRKLIEIVKKKRNENR